MLAVFNFFLMIALLLFAAVFYDQIYCYLDIGNSVSFGFCLLYSACH